jgi:hypothetical protein
MNKTIEKMKQQAEAGLRRQYNLDMIEARQAVQAARKTQDAREALDLATRAATMMMWWAKNGKTDGARRDAFLVAEAAMAEVRNAILPNITAEWKDD